MAMILAALGAILALAKQVAGYTSVALTVLVAVGNELGRWPVVSRLIDSKQILIRRAWGTALAVYFLLAVAYAWVEHRTDTLIIDLLGIVAMVGLVSFLARRHQPRVAEDDVDGDGLPDNLMPRGGRRVARQPRSAGRTPRRAAAGGGDEELSPLPPPRSGDEEEPPPPTERRRRRRVPRY